MNLNFLNDLNNNIKENKFISGFLKDLENFLNKNNNNLSYIENILENTKLMPKYRDKLYLMRNNFLCNYSNDKKIFYIYGKNITSNNYNVNIYQNNKFLESIQLSPSQLPQNVNIDSILTYENNNYILDNNLSVQLKNDLEKACSSLLEEQNVFLDKNRIENHIYEVVEKSSDTVSLLDKTIYNSTGNSYSFEEFNFPSKLFDVVDVGFLVKFSNGEYQLLNE